MSSGRIPDHPARAPLSDARVERIIGRLLQVGVLVSALIVGAGAVPLLARHGNTVVDFSQFGPGTSALNSVTGIVQGVVRLDSRAMVQFGLVLLIATPVARVALTLVAFALQRDRVYVAITAIVLALLLYGLFWGAHPAAP